MQTLPKLVDENGAAEILAVSVRSLRSWRVNGGGPTYVKLGRAVRYAEADLIAWISANARRHTATAGEVRHG